MRERERKKKREMERKGMRERAESKVVVHHHEVDYEENLQHKTRSMNMI